MRKNIFSSKNLVFIFILFLTIFLTKSVAICFTKGDIDDNGYIDLKEAIYSLQVVAGVDHDWRTLDQIKAYGKIKIGILNWNITGFYVNEEPPVGIEADLARALAIAVFPEVPIGDIDSKIEFISTTSSYRFVDLQKKKFDVLLRVATFSLSRDRNSNDGPNLHFCPTYFYDGQGIMGNSNWVLSDLNGKKIAVSADEASKYNLYKFMSDKGYTYTEVPYSSPTDPQMYSDYEAGSVDAVSADKSILLDFKTGMTASENNKIFDVALSKHPLSPVVRYGDDQWTDIVTWVVYALIRAEELGLTSSNIDEPPNIDNPAVKRFLGIEGTLGTDLGLANTWAKEIIRKIGNYGQIYNKSTGPVGIPRGLNNLFANGGVLYSPPMR